MGWEVGRGHDSVLGGNGIVSRSCSMGDERILANLILVSWEKEHCTVLKTVMPCIPFGFSFLSTGGCVSHAKRKS